MIAHPIGILSSSGMQFIDAQQEYFANGKIKNQ